MKRRITQNPSDLSRIPFVEDLMGLQIKKAMCQGRSKQLKGAYELERPRINHAFISVHDHDCLNLPRFLERLKKEGPGNLRSEKTVNLFLVDKIMNMPYETYGMTLEAFERGISLDQYYRWIKETSLTCPITDAL